PEHRRPDRERVSRLPGGRRLTDRPGPGRGGPGADARGARGDERRGRGPGSRAAGPGRGGAGGGGCGRLRPAPRNGRRGGCTMSERARLAAILRERAARGGPRQWRLSAGQEAMWLLENL